MQPNQAVFIVDDDPGVRKSLCALVASNGLRALAYESAQAFLDSGDFRSPGCIVADVQMDGMSGFELHAELQRREIDLPMIIVTGYAEFMNPNVGKTYEGELKVLEKTCSPDELWGAIEAALARN